MMTEGPYDMFLQFTEHTKTNCSTCKNNDELKSKSFKSEVLSAMIKRGVGPRGGGGGGGHYQLIWP